MVFTWQDEKLIQDEYELFLVFDMPVLCPFHVSIKFMTLLIYQESIYDLQIMIEL